MSETITPAYRIQTPRLVLRCWSPADAPKLKAAIDQNLDHLQAWESWAMKEPSPLEEIGQRIRKFRSQFDRDEGYTLGIFNTDESLVLGCTGLHKREALEIGYWIHKDHVGYGLATEAAAALTRVAFEVHKIPRVEIRCDPDNHRSAAIPARLGYTREAVLRQQAVAPDGQPRDTVVWGLVRSEYPSSIAAQQPIEAFDAAGVRIPVKETP